MELLQIQAIKKEIELKIELGDYVTLGKMLGVPQNTARMRFKRDNLKAVEAMKLLIESRDQLIKSYKESLS
ncbi:hypothetical protein [Corallibacter sp.]|uniref:hypothetical protein n=1 Tax=Corallibacter sp. TaxID=2038084 RepID=UPI003A8FBE6B